MASLPCHGPQPVRLYPDPCFQPCESQEGDEIFANGIFEFNITRLLAYIGAAGGLRAELIALGDISHSGDGAGLSEQTVVAADLSRPVILAEIAPSRYNLIDGHHRVAKARRAGVPSVLAHRIRCPEHVAFLTSTRAYEAYVEYWNSKLEAASAAPMLGGRTRSIRARRSAGGSVNRAVRRK
jgi:hypothetical protein